MQRDFYVSKQDLKPRIYYRLTDNWIEMNARFLTRERGSREQKGKMSREFAMRSKLKKIEIATASFEVLGTTSIRPVSDGKEQKATT